ncbi:MAG TPA: Nif3-like dinuclear metal center hexameric protein, partial [Tepidisphaeraceae bacterium]|nr:Nif3-like dinuclear metal center hexameric protein [Tepidisphaeraceae bacterium]
DSNPSIGKPGEFETANEWRIETVLPIDRVGRVLDALRKSHPYETPAFDLVQLATEPDSRIGLGRVGQFPESITAEMAVNLLKRSLGIDHVLHAGDPTKLVKKVAVCAGACGGDLLSAAIAQKVDLYVTGEMRHHDALRAIRSDVNVVCTLHSNSERIVLDRLKSKLAAQLNDLSIHISKQDRDPFGVA